MPRQDGSEPVTPPQQDVGEAGSDVEMIIDGPGDPMDLDDDESWADIDDFEGEPVGFTGRNDDEWMGNDGTTGAQAGSEAEGGVEDLDDDDLLQAQLRGEDTPQVDFVSKLSQHLLHFKGCSVEDHLHTLEQHDLAADSLLHIPLSGYAELMAEARLPPVLDKASLLTAAERRAYPQPDWQRIFEGALPPPGNGEDEPDLDLSSDDEETDLDEQDPDFDHTATDSESNPEQTADEAAPAYGREHTDLCLHCS